MAQNTTPQNTTEHVLQHREKLRSPCGPRLKHKIWSKREGSRQEPWSREDLETFWGWPGESSPGRQGEPNKPEPGSFTGESPTHGAAILLSKRFWCSPHNQAIKVKQLWLWMSRGGFFLLLFSFTSYSQLLNYRKLQGQSTLKSAAAGSSHSTRLTCCHQIPLLPMDG